MLSLKDSIKQIHYIRLVKDEDILPSLILYCKNNKIESGFVFGIGAVKKANLGYFDVISNQYLSRKFDFNAEILNCSGNVSKKANTGEYVIHIHMLLGDRECRSFGGHLMNDTMISVTGEFVIVETSNLLTRNLDEEFGLFLLNFTR